MRRPAHRSAVPAVASLLALAALLAAAGEPTRERPAPQAPAATEQAGSESPQVPGEIAVNGATLAKRVPPKPGDICIVCNHPVNDDDVVFLVSGHRMPIHLQELSPDVRGQLKGLLAQLEPRGAFIRAEQNQPALSKVWFFAGFYVLVGLVFAALCAHRALHTGHSPARWFFIGLLLNLLGYLLLLARPKRDVQAPAGVPAGLRKVAATYAPEPCPRCGTLNHPSASVCLGCGGKLRPKTVSEVARAGLRTA